jgi:ATPase subunit of ABC transporter with duplicated ATPase domains
MLHLNDVTLRIGGRPLLERASVHLPAGQRTGLVGANGSGKTSLLRLVLGELSPDAGEVRLRRTARVGWVAQEAPGGERTPRQAVLDADRERAQLLSAAESAREPDARLREHRRPLQERERVREAGAVLDHGRTQLACAREACALAPERVAQRRRPAGQVVTEGKAAGVIVPVAEAEVAPGYQAGAA